MAVINLTPYNTIAVPIGAATQLVAPPGHYNLTLLNMGTAPVFIKNASTASASDAASFGLPVNVPCTLVIWGPDGIWIATGASAGSVSALLQPRGA